MTEATMSSAMSSASATPTRRDIGLKKRHAAEARFRLYGIVAIAVGVGFLALLLISIVSKGYTAFVQTEITVPVFFDPAIIDKDNVRATEPKVLQTANYPVVARKRRRRRARHRPCRQEGDEGVGGFVSDGSRALLRNMVTANPAIVGTTQTVSLLAAGDIDSANKGQIDLSVPEAKRKVSDQQIEWLNALKQKGIVTTGFNWGLFTFGASSRPETSGLGVALIGSLYMMLIVVVWACPSASPPRSISKSSPRRTAHRSHRSQHQQPGRRAVDRLRPARPCRVHQLLRAAAFRAGGGRAGADADDAAHHHHRHPRRAALGAALDPLGGAGIGASKMQMVFDHVLPLQRPAFSPAPSSGSARALGETAPLLLIGMVAFVADAPANPLQPATALPVQIYMWTNEAERAFVERTSARSSCSCSSLRS